MTYKSSLTSFSNHRQEKIFEEWVERSYYQVRSSARSVPPDFTISGPASKLKLKYWINGLPWPHVEYCFDIKTVWYERHRRVDFNWIQAGKPISVEGKEIEVAVSDDAYHAQLLRPEVEVSDAINPPPYDAERVRHGKQLAIYTADYFKLHRHEVTIYRFMIAGVDEMDDY